MPNLATAVTAANEIVKAADFAFAHDQAINNIAVVLRAILAEPEHDLVIGGAVKPYQSGGMNVRIEPVFAHCWESGIVAVDTEIIQPVSIEAAHQNYDRIDTVQARGVEDPYDTQGRRFRDPETKVETTANMATKKRIALEIAVKKGFDGSAAAPPADAGWVKLAEISVPAGTVAIEEENIKNITARFAGAENENWTSQQNRTFNPGYLTGIMEKFLVSHGGNGRLKAQAVLASMIKFGSGDGGVNGAGIPSGLPVKIAGTQYGETNSVSQVLEALAEAESSAFPYANNLLSRYSLLGDSPAAASTGNVNVAAGGAFAIDGIPCSTGQLVFLKNQADPKENGFWEVKPGAWTRYPGYTPANPGAFNNRLVYCKAGTANGGKTFYMDKEAGIGADDLVFRESIYSPRNLPGKIPIRDTSGNIDEIAAEALSRQQADTSLLSAIAAKLDKSRRIPFLGVFNNYSPLIGALGIAEGGDFFAWSGPTGLFNYSPFNQNLISGHIYSLSSDLTSIGDWGDTGYAALNADTGSGADVTTPAVPSNTIKNIMQTMWAKTRQVGNVAAAAMPKAGGTFSGAISIPSKTGAAVNNGTAVASEAQVYLKANLASPTFTGTPTAPEITSIPYVKNPGTNVLNNWGNQIVSMNTLRNAIRDRISPVSGYYTQYSDINVSTVSGMFPANESPATLFGGLWTEMFVGEEVFFKTSPTSVESNRGKTYNTVTRAWDVLGTVGIQGDAIRNFPGKARLYRAGLDDTAEITGPFSRGDTWRSLGSANSTTGERDLNFNPAAVVPVDTTNHPRNRLIKVWKRTA